jgi:hypothetical protein
MESLALAVLFGGALVYGMYVAGRACKSDEAAIRRTGSGLTHEL